MEVTLYEFSKRDDSTKRPGGGKSFSGSLKEMCSTTNPSVSFDGLGNPAKYNYAYIPAFHRYYYIESWVNNENLWTANMKTDVLASWKSEIGSTSVYALRASNSYDGKITDSFYPTIDSDTVLTTFTNPWEKVFSNGRYVVGIAGAGGGVGGVCYYVLTQAQFNAFRTYLFETFEFEGWDLGEYTKDFVKTTFNPFQFVVSCMWFPMAVGTGGVTTIKCGWIDTPVSGSFLASTTCIKKSTAVAIPQHPQAGERGIYTNLSPYTKHTLFFPPFGIVPIDTSYFMESHTIHLDYTIDFITGTGQLFIGNGTGAYTSVFGQVGIPIQVTGMQNNALNVTSSVIDTVGGTLGGITSGVEAGFSAGGMLGGAIGGFLGGVGKAISGIASTAQASAPSVQTTGSNGGVGSYAVDPFVTSEFFKIAPEDISHHGRPCCKVVTPAGLGGYIQCLHGDVKAPATAGELAEIKSRLEGGFYYE